MSTPSAPAPSESHGELDEASTCRNFRQVRTMNLTTFSGDFPTARDICIAKNYLTEDELKILNNIVSGYFDFAEVQALHHHPMYMSDNAEHLNRILSATGEKVLASAGRISHKQAVEKANQEYQRFLIETPSPVEKAYLTTIREAGKAASERAREA